MSFTQKRQVLQRARRVHRRLIDAQLMAVLPLILVGLIVGYVTAFNNPAEVNLGQATYYAVLASSTITSTGNTVINGDVGLTPGSTVTGSPTVHGSTNIANGAAQAAQASLLTAYNYCAGLAADATMPKVELGGMTLTPGVYTAGANQAMQISTALTLDGQGLASPIFIFQMGTTLNLNTGGSIVLINSSEASGVFWQVGSSVTIAASTAMVGTMLAHTAISFGTSATLNGRALALNAAVTMISNTITSPAANGGAAAAAASTTASTSVLAGGGSSSAASTAGTTAATSAIASTTSVALTSTTTATTTSAATTTAAAATSQSAAEVLQPLLVVLAAFVGVLAL